VHYIIHACDNPTLAADGLKASDRYGLIAPAGAHAVHMPGHIYARLGMWPQDIQANLQSVTAAETAEAHHESSIMHEPHSYDFLLYAYLQSAQDAKAKGVLDQVALVLNQMETMPGTGGHRDGMVPYYRVEMPAFYMLEMRDWKSASALEPAPGSLPEIALTAYWARTIAAGRLHDAALAQADMAKTNALIEEVKKGRHAYMVEGTGVKISLGEMLAWTAFAEGKKDEALRQMGAAADLQDKVGQNEVDIPAREMLADMLLEFHEPQQALVEYQKSLKLSPNRFNGLYGAGLAAEAAGEKAQAQQYYATLLKTTDNGAHSSRPEFAHVKTFLASSQVAQN
jgi:tetratricopeptide (TPR) repeat protein